MTLNTTLGWPIVIDNVTIRDFTLEGVNTDLSSYPTFVFMYILTTLLFTTMIIFFSIYSYTMCRRYRLQNFILEQKKQSNRDILLENVFPEDDPLMKL